MPVMPACMPLTSLLLLTVIISMNVCSGEVGSKSSNRIFHNQFAVHIPNANILLVEQLARKHGFHSLGQIGSLEDYYLFQHDRIHKRSLEPSDYHHENLINEPEVAWVEQQHERKRIKRDDFESSGSSPVSAAITASGLFALGRGTEFPDPFYRDQWYLHGGSQEGFDMNVIPAWAKGYSGKGVVVSILDDGIQTNHPDLAQNYDPLASSDINDNDSDPMPRDNGDNKHGTRCAGEVAAVAFNSYCGVGVAFNASIGGVRMLDGTVNDAVEARALSLNPDHIDIYSASWGPEDDGKTVDGPGPLAKRAFINGIMKGRNGKGSIFVWASGNGGRHEDSCNCDGYTNSIFTLSISSATQGGLKPWYLEECSSTLATTYSSGRPDVDRSISTVDMDGSLRPEFLCTSEHTGTSASAPIAAGICALALEANPNLTWRDMQHLVVFTSRADPLHDNSWVVNGIGKKVSHKYGYGLMDASAMVTLAEQWINVPPQHVCQNPADTSDRPIPNGFGQKLEIVVETDACSGTAHEIRFLEHVQCRISLRFAPRGNLRIRLTSPSGTQSVLLFERPRDVLDSSFEEWPFMSVHFWGERASGRWKLEILNAGNKRVNKAGILKKWQLVFYGTEINPVRLRPPQSAKPTLIPVATIGRDVHGAIPPTGLPAVTVTPIAAQLVTPAAPTFDSVGTVSRKPGILPQGPFSFPGVPGFRPTYFPNTGFPDFLQFAGSEPVTYSTSLSSASISGSFSSQTRPNCPKFSLDGSCMDSCPAIGYYSSADQQCIACDSSCTTCTGPGALQCLSCSSGFSRMMDKNICLETCPDTYRLDERNGTCIPCPPQCSKCDESSSCSACQSRLVLDKGRCLAACPSGFYETDNMSCAPCDPACTTCHGPGENHCVTCSSGRSESISGTCVQNCPSGTWPAGRTLIRQCLPCPPGCANCSLKEDGFGLECGTCRDDVAGQWALDSSSRLCVNPAVNLCQEGEYSIDAKCYPCHGSCAQCMGPSAGQCTRCAPEQTMYSGSCLASCPEGTFIESGSDGKYCRPCPFACARCDGLDRCTECLGSLQLQDGQCLVSCQNGYYSDRGLCVLCHGSCAACAGPLATDCTACRSGFAWFQQRCLSQCPMGHYNTSIFVPGMDFCGRCHPSCGTCNGPSFLDCITCADGFIQSNRSCILLPPKIVTEDGPIAQYVKESDGRGIRAKEDVNEAAGPPYSIYSSWMVGIGISFFTGLIVVIAVQVRSRMADKYSRVSLENVQDHRRRRTITTEYDNGETRGAQVLLLSSSDECGVTDDEEDYHVIPRV